MKERQQATRRAIINGGSIGQARKAAAIILTPDQGGKTPCGRTLVGEVRRAEGRLDQAAILVDRGLLVTTRAEYWYGVGFSQRVAGRLACDRGAAAEARAAFEKAADTFERIHATFEARRTRRELSQLPHCSGPARTPFEGT